MSSTRRDFRSYHEPLHGNGAMSRFEDSFRMLVTLKGKQLVAERVVKVRHDIQDAIWKWRNDIKARLSRPYAGRPNDTDTPFMRTGTLRDSIPQYQAVTQKTFQRHKYDLGQTVIKVHRRNYKPAWDSYGEKLNRWSSYTDYPTQLDGWQERAYNVLADRIDKALGYTKDYYKY